MRSINRHGTTLIELVIAMAVTGALALVVLAAYGGVVKGFTWQTRRAAAIQEMLLVRLEISRTLERVGTVRSHRKNALEYREEGADTARTLAFGNGALYRDGEKVAGGLSAFELGLREKRSSDGRSMLVWEAVLRGDRWIGGAVAVRVEE
jgi:prepilin-type N-terminal cleavage/methylation domain-containing protein